ncbi:MAG TPA: hypothetical protein VK815_13375 [Candidatus Acidoferrales bacterium]|jgi:hypothetical protein|nr:hypothetical protein [Candidatus Acidoferrales bacterium]
MSKKNQPPLFYRSFHLTVGGMGLLLPVLIWASQGSQSGSWPQFAWILFFCLPIAGIGFLLFGIFASDQKIASMRIAAFDSTILIAILAVPLYVVLSGIQRKRRERLLHKKHDHVA